METLNEKIDHVLGMCAFMKGLKAIPVQDENLRICLKGLKVGQSKPLLEAWYRGYYEALKIMETA
jgi:hypothetical protein